MRELTLNFLGTPIVVYNETAVKLPTRKATALLAYLAATQAAQRRETLLALLWPELNHSRGLAALRTTLSALRKAFDGEWIVTEGDVIRLADGYTSDLHQFQQKMSLAQAAIPSQQITHLKNAVALHRGKFLAGFTLADSTTFDEWQFHQTEYWQQQQSVALRVMCAALLKQNEIESAIPFAQQWVAQDPLHEPAQRFLINLYSRNHQRSAALRQFSQFKQLLADELGVAPEPETAALIAKKPPHQPPTTSHQLPADSSLLPFIGRVDELATIRNWLGDENGRLLTITGVGGAGKSRLALQVARESKRPSVFVPLAAISDPALIVGAVAQALHFSFYGRGEPQAQLIDFLRNKTMLLVLDNFEQIVAGAPLLLDILNQAPEVKILATSRERLHLRGEWVLELQGLPVAAANGHITDAVRLFYEVAQRIRPSFHLDTELEAVTHICQLVDGMPLGIELAAAWVRLLSCRDIGSEIEKNLDFLATTLQDVPERQRSLRAVFLHSWQLLGKKEQRIFRQLAVFRGGFTREAATAVLNISLPDLITLIDKSLLHQDGNGRFEIPMALQTYAQEKLDEHIGEKTEVLDAHCLYFAEWVGRFAEDLRGGGQKEALTAVQSELENISAAWQHAANLMDGHALQAIAKPLFHFFEMRNLFQEGVDLFGKVPSRQPRGTATRPVVTAQLLQGHFLHRLGQRIEAGKLLHDGLHHARILQADAEIAFGLNSLGYMAWGESAYTQAETYYRESLRIYRRLDDQWGMSQVLNNLAILPQNRPDMKLLLEESLAIARNKGDLWSEVRSLNNLGIVETNRAESSALYQTCLDICRDINNQFLMTFPLINLGHAARLSGDFATARDYYQESLTICEEIGYRAGSARSLGQLGAAAYHLGQFNAARRFCEDGLAISHALGDQRGVGLLEYTLGMIERAAATPHSAQAHFENSLTTFRQAKDRQGEAWPLLGLAQLALVDESWDFAHAQADDALNIFESIGDQAGQALAAGILGTTAPIDTQAQSHIKQAVDIANELNSPPLLFEVLVLVAMRYFRLGQLAEAYRIVVFVGRETAVSAPIQVQAREIQDKVSQHLQNSHTIEIPENWKDLIGK